MGIKDWSISIMLNRKQCFMPLLWVFVGLASNAAVDDLPATKIDGSRPELSYIGMDYEQIKQLFGPPLVRDRTSPDYYRAYYFHPNFHFRVVYSNNGTVLSLY
jgi:hypothetical protein